MVPRIEVTGFTKSIIVKYNAHKSSVKYAVGLKKDRDA